MRRAIRLLVVLWLHRGQRHPVTMTGYYRRYRRWSTVRSRYKIRWLRERARADHLERFIEGVSVRARAHPPDLGDTEFYRPEMECRETAA